MAIVLLRKVFRDKKFSICIATLPMGLNFFFITLRAGKSLLVLHLTGKRNAEQSIEYSIYASLRCFDTERNAQQYLCLYLKKIVFIRGSVVPSRESVQ